MKIPALILLLLGLTCGPGGLLSPPPIFTRTAGDDAAGNSSSTTEIGNNSKNFYHHETGAEQLEDNNQEPIVTYLIEAQLYPQDRELTASETITWRNTSTMPVKNLPFHLFYNAYRNLDTTFMKESGLDVRTRARGNENELLFGEIKITRINRIGPGEPIDLSKLQFIAPDDNNPNDHTVAELTLEQPLQPDETIRLRIDFTLTIPQIFDRTGVKDDYFFIAHWFPKIGVLNATGQWYCHQYHAHTGFFSNYGYYRVALTIPGQYVVGATGNMIKSVRNANNSVTYHYEENHIHDFAWVAYPYFNRVSESILLPGNPRPTVIQFLLAPGHDSVKERTLEALKFAMTFYAERIFPYPYKRLTVVDFPFGSHPGIAMEFPTLITTSYTSLLPDACKLPEINIIHEFGHQYWYGLVGNNEATEAWLDEGVNTFFQLEILDEFFRDSPSFLDWDILPVQAWEVTRMQYTSSLPVDPVLQESWKFLNQDIYEAHVYAKTAILLRSLKQLVGRERLFNFFKYYAQKFKLKHPTSDDFIDTFSAFMEEDFSWAFDQYIRTPTALDLAVHSIRSVKTSSLPETYTNEAVFVRKEGYFPAELLITLANGKEIKSYWHEKNKWKRLVFEDVSPIRQAVVDPAFKIPLDKNFLNNATRVNPGRRGIRRLALKSGFSFQNFLSTVIF